MQRGKCSSPGQGTKTPHGEACQHIQGFPGGSAGKESAYNAGDRGSIPVLGRSPGEGKGYPLQYSGLENSMDSIGHGVAKSWTQLSDFNFQAKLKTLSHLCVCKLAMRTKPTVN